MERADPNAADQLRRMMQQQEQHAAAVKERALAIFDKLLLLPEFKAWMKENIIIRDEIDEENKTITTYVIYKPTMSDTEKAKLRPSNFDELSAEEQWGIDKELGILDWDGQEGSVDTDKMVPPLAVVNGDSSEENKD
jgi:hypothetical protein